MVCKFINLHTILYNVKFRLLWLSATADYTQAPFACNQWASGSFRFLIFLFFIYSCSFMSSTLGECRFAAAKERQEQRGRNRHCRQSHRRRRSWIPQQKRQCSKGPRVSPKGKTSRQRSYIFRTKHHIL